jgi:hypothetical protein
VAADRRTAGSKARQPVVEAEIPVVGPREPCPCGSGRRYKACHGSAARATRTTSAGRPFEGLPGEADWVALREVVPAATVPLVTRDGREVTLSTVLPMAAAAMVRLDGRLFLGLQTTAPSTDVSRDLGHALARALAADAGTVVASEAAPPDGPRLQDLLDVTAPFEVTVRAGFDYWLEGVDNATADGAEVAASMERANAGVTPTARLAEVDAAYWAQVGERTALRWVLPEPEDELLDALARLHADGGLSLGDGTRFIGTFRAHGLLVPVWDLVPGTSAAEAEEPAAGFRARVDASLAERTPLTSAQRHARAGLQTRQLTLR